MILLEYIMSLMIVIVMSWLLLYYMKKQKMNVVLV